MMVLCALLFIGLLLAWLFVALCWCCCVGWFRFVRVFVVFDCLVLYCGVCVVRFVVSCMVSCVFVCSLVCGWGVGLFVFVVLFNKNT